MLGSGTFGKVYPSDDDHIAIKEFRAPEDNKPSCLGETVFLKYLENTRYIVRLILVEDIHEGIPSCIYISRHGTSLDKLITKKRLPVRSISHQLVDSLAHIHHMGVVHRDISLTNVLYDEGVKTILLCDFGSAFLADIIPPDAPLLTSSTGRKLYRSPHKPCGRITTVDAIHCDLYAAGAIIAMLESESDLGMLCHIVGSEAEPVVRALQTPGKTAEDVLKMCYFKDIAHSAYNDTPARAKGVLCAPPHYPYAAAEWLRDDIYPQHEWNSRKAACLATAINMHRQFGNVTACIYIAVVFIQRETFECDITNETRAKITDIVTKADFNIIPFIPVMVDSIVWTEEIIRETFFPDHKF